MDFRTMHILIPDNLPITHIDLVDLPADWADFEQYSSCQAIGDRWFDTAETPILCVPSAIIPHESNYLLHTRHPAFSQIVIKEIEPFQFDPRIK